MKKCIIIIFVSIFCLFSLNSQTNYMRFEKDLKRSNIKINNIDSLSVSYAKCIAYYDGFFKSSMTNNKQMLSLLKKSHTNIYMKLKKITDACVLYQKDNDEKSPDLYADLYPTAIPKIIDLSEGQLVLCNIIIITLYDMQQKQEQKRYIITSMEKLK